jgi:hypothetical protein
VQECPFLGVSVHCGLGFHLAHLYTKFTEIIFCIGKKVATAFVMLIGDLGKLLRWLCRTGLLIQILEMPDPDTGSLLNLDPDPAFYIYIKITVDRTFQILFIKKV